MFCRKKCTFLRLFHCKSTTFYRITQTKLMILFLFPTALSFKEKKMTKAPLPDSVRIGQVSLAVFQIVIFSLKSNFFHFWAKNRISRVKLLEICLISSAKFISCSRILPCGTNFLLLLRCDWAYTRQSNVFGQVSSFFNVTNWFSPIKLRKICHLTKLFIHLFCWKINKIALSIRPQHPL